MQSTRATFAGVFVVLYAVGLGYACSKKDEAPPSDDEGGGYSNSGPGAVKPAAAKTYTASATILPTTDASRVEGTVDLVEKEGETTVTVQMRRGGFPSSHGLHIFENGSCEAIDGGPALAAGEHWNPTDAGHGLPSTPNHHLGDLGNVDVDYTGRGSVTLTSKEFYLHDGGQSVVGRAVIFHEWPDDGVSPIDGNSGPRAGCGVIQLDDDARDE